MKAKIISIILVILALICALTACNADKQTNTEHTHDYGKWIEEVPSTCVTQGAKGHYHCAGCGKNFDADHTEISNLTLPLADHTYGELHAAVAADCEHNGNIAYYQCSVCQQRFDEEKHFVITISTPALGHDYSADYVCTRCGDGTEKGTAGLGYTLENNSYTVYKGTVASGDVVIPRSYHGFHVTAIDQDAFKRTDITSIIMPDTLTSIGKGAFQVCDKLTSVTIPDGVTNIPDSAFYYCDALTSVTIPSSVTSIDFYAFGFCSSLTSINYQGTKAQWHAITKDIKWNSATGAYTVHCTDGDISKANS